MQSVFAFVFLIVFALGVASFNSLRDYEGGAKWSKGVAGFIFGLIGFIVSVIMAFVISGILLIVFVFTATLNLFLFSGASYILLKNIRRFNIRVGS